MVTKVAIKMQPIKNFLEDVYYCFRNNIISYK